MSFLKCDQGCDGSCDPTTSYVAELDAALEDAVGYAKGYCEACAANCRRRRLDEAKDAYEEISYSADCKTCEDQCAYVNGNNGNANGLDESEYLDCQYQYTDDDGLDYYGAPTCSQEGMMAMGLFYDGA